MLETKPSSQLLLTFVTLIIGAEGATNTAKLEKRHIHIRLGPTGEVPRADPPSGGQTNSGRRPSTPRRRPAEHFGDERSGSNEKKRALIMTSGNR